MTNPDSNTTNLAVLLKQAAVRVMSPEERREQRISFVWGMLPFRSTLTKDDVREALKEHLS